MSERKLEWQDLHLQREWGRWPETALVRFASRTFKEKKRARGRALDLGCGAGASSWFLASEGFVVDGIDKSPAAVQRSIERVHHQMSGHRFWYGDIADMLPFKNDMFDLAVDVCTTQHIRGTPRLDAIGNVYQVLKPGGWLFSMCLADGSSPDVYEEVGAVPLRFDEIESIYRGFVVLDVESESRTDGGRIIRHWVITARK